MSKFLFNEQSSIHAVDLPNNTTTMRKSKVTCTLARNSLHMNINLEYGGGVNLKCINYY